VTAESAMMLAWDHIAQALAGQSLVLVDRLGAAGRTWTHPPTLLPAMTFSLYDSWPAAAEHTVIALERLTRRRDSSIRRQWLEELWPTAAEYLIDLGTTPAVYGWYETPTLRAIAELRGGTLLAHSQPLVTMLESKTAFSQILRSAGVSLESSIESIVLGTGTSVLGFDELRRRLDADILVVQADCGSGGRGTFFVQNDIEFATATATLPVRVSPYVPGPSGNITALTVPDGRTGCSIYVDLPSLKGIAVAALGIGSAKSAGNDWSVVHPKSHVRRIVDALERIGRWAYRKHRFAGLWGIDVIWSPKGPRINEINPRIQGSTETSSGNQLLRGIAPLVLGHLAILLDTEPHWLPPADEFNTETVRLAAIPNRTAPFYLKLRATELSHGSVDFRGSGVYGIDSATSLLEWRRPGAIALDANLDQGEVLLANAALHGTTCAPGAEVATLEGLTSHPVFSSSGNYLAPSVEAIVAAARTVLGRP
jgi:hypothetical protein